LQLKLAFVVLRGCYVAGLLTRMSFHTRFHTKPSQCLCLRRLMVQMCASLVCMYRNMAQSLQCPTPGK